MGSDFLLCSGNKHVAGIRGQCCHHLKGHVRSLKHSGALGGVSRGQTEGRAKNSVDLSTVAEKNGGLWGRYRLIGFLPNFLVEGKGFALLISMLGCRLKGAPPAYNSSGFLNNFHNRAGAAWGATGGHWLLQLSGDLWHLALTSS